MNEAFKLAREYKVKIELADLGDWGIDELRSEYDPAGPTIRLNERIAENLPAAQIGEFVTLAIAHELYHHRERLGEIERLPDRAARELAADEFARRILAAS
ncbi:MAG: hypothetical protein ACXWNK_05770 [Vulcanimicrobiaceae bacterium]